MDSNCNIKTPVLKDAITEELHKPNYLIETSDSKGDYTAIYFSSCGIYDSDDMDDFQSKIVNKNRFECYGLRIEKASKHIFIRDINKKWYLNGINTEIDSIEKLLELLKEKTKGSQIITVGASSGGFAAVLFGILLNSEYIFSFSGQYSLLQYGEFIEAQKNIVNNEYFDLSAFIKTSGIPIFYMLPTRSQQDEEQYNLVKDFENVYVLPIKSSVHGLPIIKDTMRSIINSDLTELKKMYNYRNTSISEIAFLKKHFGMVRAASRVIKKNFSCLKKKFGS